MLLKLNQSFLILALLVSIAVILPSSTVDAQCAMCKAAAESNLEAGGSAGKGLNTGILFMLTMPYLLIGSILFLWWKNRRKDADINMGD